MSFFQGEAKEQLDTWTEITLTWISLGVCRGSGESSADRMVE